MYTIEGGTTGEHRGFLAAGENIESHPVLAEIGWSTYSGNSTDAIDGGKNWYVRAAAEEGKFYIYNLGLQKFIAAGSGTAIDFSDTPYLWTIVVNGSNNSYNSIRDTNETTYLCFACGKKGANRPVHFNNQEGDGGSMHTFTAVQNGTTTYATQIATADAAIEAVLNASFSFNYISGENATNTWSEALSVYPAGLSNEVACDGGKGNSAQHIGVAGHSVHKAVSAINAKGGNVTVTFQYNSSLGNNAHAISTLGVDVVNANGEVVASDYHLGFSGGSSFSNTYTLSGLAAGNYILRYYVCNLDGDHELNNTSGTITVNGALEITEAATVAAMWETLKGKVNHYEVYKGNGLGYYPEALVDAIVEKKEATPTEDVSAYTNAFTALDDAIDATRITQPEAGKFYRFKHPTKDAYMLSDNYSNTRLAMGALETGTNKVTSIFYCGEKGNLLSYAIGRYLPKAAGGGNWTCLAVGEEGPSATFGAGSKPGRLGFYIGDDMTRSYYSATEGQVNAGGTFGSSEGYDWVVEEVEWLPVAMNATVGFATIYSPVQLELSSGRVKAYTATREGNVLTLVEQTVVPANTGVILELQEGKEGDVENGYVFLQVQDATVEVEGNALVGSFAKSEKNAEANVYTLQAPKDKAVGFYLFKGQDAEGATTYINGFRAWVEVAEGEEAPAMFTLGRGGEDEDATGIDQLINNGEVVIYDLAGRRVEKMEKGIYIVNGKKVIR